MKTRNISSSLKNKTKGWVAIDKKNQVIATANSFSELCGIVEKKKEELTLVPAAKSYFGFIT